MAAKQAGRTLLLVRWLVHLCQHLFAFFRCSLLLDLLVTPQLFTSSSYLALLDVSSGACAAGIKQPVFVFAEANTTAPG